MALSKLPRRRNNFVIAEKVEGDERSCKREEIKNKMNNTAAVLVLMSKFTN